MELKNTAMLVWFTCKELLFKKTFWAIFTLFSLFLFLVPLWEVFSPESQEVLLTSMGRGIVGFFLFIMTVMVGAYLIPEDIEKGRAAFFLMRPMRKSYYLIGRCFGAFLFLACSFVTMVIFLKIFFMVKGWSFDVLPQIFMLLKYFILGAFLFSFSHLVERFSAIFFGIAFYFLASSLSTLTVVAKQSGNVVMIFWMNTVGNLLPHLELFDVAAKSLDGFYALKAILYASMFIALYLGIGSLTLRRLSK